MFRRAASLGLGLFVIGCSAPTAELAARAPERPEGAAAPTERAPDADVADTTRSAWPDERPSPLASACGDADAALTRVAVRLADERARGLGAPDPDAVVSRLRAAGVPHTRPRVLTASGRAPLDADALRAKLGALRAKGREGTRCGVGVARTPHGGEVLVAVAVDALADLAPLPVRARTGEWLTFDAQLRVGARDAKLVVLGPRGAPRTVPTALDPRGRARARFALDRPGAFLVQLVADTEGGPRPLLEARVFADVPASPAESAGEPAPGEAPGDDLAAMIAAVRDEAGLPPLARDARLDALAAEHAARMRDARTVAHDLGDGDPRARAEAASVDGKVIGENVAHAETVALAHRALHASPSHRMNLLGAAYTHVGVAVARGDDGTVYVCELFTSLR